MAVGGSSTSAPVGTSIYSSRTTPAKVGGKPGELGKDDFMKLLMTQLQNQDPMKPMDDQAFMGQVAQFQTLDQISAMNAAITSLLETQKLAEASGLIGKTISALDADAKRVTGTVTAAAVIGGKATVYIGSTSVPLDKVTAVASSGDTLPTIPLAAAA